MTNNGPFSLMSPEADPHIGNPEPRYWSARGRITQLLIQYTLIESLHKFRKAEEAYPFLTPAALRPGAMVPTKEYSRHNNALIILLGGTLPERMRKHFRCRSNNMVQKKTISAVAPGLPGLDGYDPAGRWVDHERFGDMLRLLLPLDYSLLVQNTSTEKGKRRNFQLTHFHVKIERLTDSALRSLGMQLNYLKQGLYERGEAFVEDLEKKFFEYFNFYHNAAGRRSAAALAAQLMAREKRLGTVFITSQQDRRLSLLSSTGASQDVLIEQYLLLPLGSDELRELIAWGATEGLEIVRDFLVDADAAQPVVVFRACYEHTEAARPSADGSIKEKLNLREKWVRLRTESIVPLNPEESRIIAYPLVFQRSAAD